MAALREPDVATEWMWMPLASEWTVERRPMIAELANGLATVGVETRVETISAPPFQISLLRVRCPAPSVERAQNWLVRIGTAEDRHDWGSGLYCRLHGMRREFGLWSGDDQQSRRLGQRLRAIRPADDHRYAGAQCALVGISSHAAGGQSRWGLSAYARTATEVIEHLPNVEIVHPRVGGECREWLAIDIARRQTEIAELADFDAGLRARGFVTARYDFGGGTFALLCVHAGNAAADELEQALAVASDSGRAPWAKRYRPWSWEASICVHCEPEPSGWTLREWLEAELGAPVVDAAGWPNGNVALRVPGAFVDTALEALGRRPR